MLHELLIALRGHPGYIYSDQDQKLRVNSSLTFLHPCEVGTDEVEDFNSDCLQVSILDSLLELGTDYRTVSQYISSMRSGGMYLAAVCEGLDMVLAEYRDTLTRLEKEMMYEGDSLPLSLVQHQLSPHRPVLRYLVKLVTGLDRERPAGVMILDRVYKASTTGVAAVGAGLRLVLAEGHKVLYKQLVAWLLQVDIIIRLI